MRMTIPALLLFLTSLFTAAYGGMLREVELSDGSVVHAEIVGMEQGMYRLRSSALGEFEVPESQVIMIRTPDRESVSASPVRKPSDTQVDAVDGRPQLSLPSAGELQHALSQDPAAMNEILSLQDDPLVQSILGDARTMQAVQAGDLGTLLNDPKIKALMKHPTVQGLSQSHGE